MSPKPSSAGKLSIRESPSLTDRGYLTAERALTAVDAAGGSVLLPDGRTVTTGRAEFDALQAGSAGGLG